MRARKGPQEQTRTAYPVEPLSMEARGKGWGWLQDPDSEWPEILRWPSSAFPSGATNPPEIDYREEGSRKDLDNSLAQ
jgi:hypothetical protein